MAAKQTPAVAPVAPVVARVSNSYIDAVIDAVVASRVATLPSVTVADIGNGHAAPCKLATLVADDIAKLASLVAGTDAAARLAKIDAKRVQRDLAYSASQRKLAFSPDGNGGTRYTARGGSSSDKLTAASDVQAAITAMANAKAPKAPKADKPAAAPKAVRKPRKS